MNPLQQGLKRSTCTRFHSCSTVAIMNPLQQGLKRPTLKMSVRCKNGCNNESTTTRIETSASDSFFGVFFGLQ